MPDDGNSNKSSNGEIQKFNFDLPIDNKGFYNLCFKVVNGSGSDFELINISFNSNKVLSSNYAYIRSPTKVYFDNLNEFKFRYYHYMDQNLIFNNGKIINIKYNNTLKGKWQSLNVVGLNSMDIEDGNLMFQDHNLYFGYWQDATYKKSLNPQLVFTQSNNLNSTQNLNILIDKLKLNLKSQKGVKLFNINIKNEE